MLTMFALMLQTASLDADKGKAAMTCAQALMVADGGKTSSIRLASQFTHLIMQVVDAKPQGKFFDQLNTLSSSVKGPAYTAEQARALVPACDARFPQARSTAPTKLPRDAFRRDVLCFGMLSILNGAAEELAKNGSNADLIKVRAALKPLGDKLSDAELKKRGLDTEDGFMTMLSNEMLDSLPLGNPTTIAAACGVPLS